MARANIPVDLFNPGQVLACLGLMEAAAALGHDAAGGFTWQANARDAQFVVGVQGEVSPVAMVLEFLQKASVTALLPDALGDETKGDELSTKKWKLPMQEAAGTAFPIPRPGSPATLPAVLEDAGHGHQLVVDHWGDGTKRDAVKLWAGAGGYPGCALMRDVLDAARPHLLSATADPFAVTEPLSSGFRLDWRRDYIPMDVGFSPNAHGNIVMAGYPIVEALAVIGLGAARPVRSGRGKLHYRYGVLGVANGDADLLPLSLHRAALGAVSLPFPQRFFEMELGWPGQEGQARCILEVKEETQS